jgi:hypothetical protein
MVILGQVAATSCAKTRHIYWWAFSKITIKFLKHLEAGPLSSFRAGLCAGTPHTNSSTTNKSDATSTSASGYYFRDGMGSWTNEKEINTKSFIAFGVVIAHFFSFLYSFDNIKLCAESLPLTQFLQLKEIRSQSDWLPAEGRLGSSESTCKPRRFFFGACAGPFSSPALGD